mgnify:CR=1 FL=1
MRLFLLHNNLIVVLKKQNRLPYHFVNFIERIGTVANYRQFIYTKEGEFYLGRTPGTATLEPRIALTFSKDGASQKVIYTTGANALVPVGSWSHVTITIDLSAALNQSSTYPVVIVHKADGALDSSGNEVGTIVNTTAQPQSSGATWLSSRTDATISISSGDCYVGATKSGSNITGYFKGAISEPAVWNATLTSVETGCLRALYTSRTADTAEEVAQVLSDRISANITKLNTSIDSTNKTKIDFMFPPPILIRILFPHPLARVIPMPNITPPIIYLGQKKTELR